MEATEVITLESVTVAYPNSTPLDDLTCEFAPTSTAVMGPSGSGKSTLLRVIAGLQKPSKGAVSIGSTPVARPSWKSAGDSRVALIHQDYRLVDFLSVSDNVRLAAELRGIEVHDHQVEESLESVGLGKPFLRRRPNSLSGGEQQRVAIARALVCDIDVLLADEPTGALDEDNTRRVAAILCEIGERGDVAVLVATHDRAVADMLRTRYELASGELSLA